MLIILPPSETKSFGGENSPLDFAALSFPALNNIRREIATDLQSLNVDEALSVLGISEKLRPAAEANTHLGITPTMPAILRYTGVLYDALDAPSLPTEALRRLAIGSALFGVLGALDPIPFYRLSGSNKLPFRAASAHAGQPAPTMKARWGKALSHELQQLHDSGELLIDLRSGTYQQLGKVTGAITVRVQSVQADGSRKVVSHFNKHYKGEFARILATADGIPENIVEVIDIARSAGLTVEEPKENGNEITLVVEP